MKSVMSKMFFILENERMKEELKEENRRLKLELTYRPGGVGFEMAKEDFDLHSKKKYLKRLSF